MSAAILISLFAAASRDPGPILASDLSGDVDDDCQVTILDLGYIADRYGVDEWSLLYHPIYDLNGDKSIDIIDLAIAANQFGRMC
jgi:hypothetical protein